MADKNIPKSDYLMMLLLLLLQIEWVLLHEWLQLSRAEYVLLEQLLHLMDAASRAEHHLRGVLRGWCPWRPSWWRTLRRIRRRTPLRGLWTLMRTRLGTRRPRTRLLRLLRNDRLLLLGHGCCCHCVSSGTELSIALILDREFLLLLLLLWLLWLLWLFGHAATYLVPVVLTATYRQPISFSVLAFPRRGNTVAWLLLLLLQGCKQRSSLQYENGDRELDQSRLRAVSDFVFFSFFTFFFNKKIDCFIKVNSFYRIFQGIFTI